MSNLNATFVSHAKNLSWKRISIFIAILVGIHFVFWADIDVRTSLGRITGHTPNSEQATNGTASSTEGSEHLPIEVPPVIDHAHTTEPSTNPTTEQAADPGGKNETLAPEEYVAICIAVKDQALDLIEYFVHHYHHMGIRRFYVMDDGSDPPLSSFEYPGVPRSVLSFTWQDPASRSPTQQLAFYDQCVEKYRSKHKWIAFLDGDEFLETPGKETLKQVLESFEDDELVGALGVNWRLHTSSGLLTRPESTRKSFTTCIYDDPRGQGNKSDNNHIKVIVKTSKAVSAISPHKFNLAEGSFTFGEDGDEITSYAWRTPITRRRIGLHHYAVKSKDEYEQKKNRGNGMTTPKDDGFWDHIEHGIPHVFCPEMAAYDP